MPAAGTNENTGSGNSNKLRLEKNRLRCNAATPTVLLLNEKYDPNCMWMWMASPLTCSVVTSHARRLSRTRSPQSGINFTLTNKPHSMSP